MSLHLGSETIDGERSFAENGIEEASRLTVRVEERGMPTVEELIEDVVAVNPGVDKAEVQEGMTLGEDGLLEIWNLSNLGLREVA